MTNVTTLFANRRDDYLAAYDLTQREEPEGPLGQSQRWNRIKDCFHSGEFAVLDQLSYVDALPIDECKSTIAAAALVQHDLIAPIKLKSGVHYHLTPTGRAIIETLWPYRFKSRRKFA